MERAFVGAYGEADTLALASAVGSTGSVSEATAPALPVAWTGGPAVAPPLDGSVGCLLDGEIHHQQIAELAHVPATSPPRRCCVAAYAQVGEELVTQLRGEFALVIWNGLTRKGLLARDHLGSQSIFLHARAAGCSSPRSCPPFSMSCRAPRRPTTALVQWLADGTVPVGQTLYAGVTPLPPASVLRLRDGRWQIACYSTPQYVVPRPLDGDEAAVVLRRGVIDAVDRRLHGRGTAGVLLSGGIDPRRCSPQPTSSTATLPASLRAYSAVFPRHEATDESELIDLQMAHYDLPVARLAVTGGSPMRGALRYLDRWRVPSPVPGHFIWEPLLEVARNDGVECMLDGEAGDELFGAAVLLIADRVRRGRVGGALRVARGLPGVGPSASARLLASLLGRYGFAPCLPRMVARRAGPRWHAPWWLASNQAGQHSLSPDSQPWRATDGPRWWAQLTDAVTRAPDRLGFFDYFRRRSRAAGVCAQHPFLDVDLIETVIRLPPEHGFDPNLSRPVLRGAMRGLVPETVRVRRSKSFFDPSLIDCLSGDDREQVARLLTAPDAEVRRFADPDGVRALVDCGPQATRPGSAPGCGTFGGSRRPNAGCAPNRTAGSPEACLIGRLLSVRRYRQPVSRPRRATVDHRTSSSYLYAQASRCEDAPNAQARRFEGLNGVHQARDC